MTEEDRPETEHRLSVTYLNNHWLVTCSQGCDLGTSAETSSIEEARRRCDLHRLAVDSRVLPRARR